MKELKEALSFAIALGNAVGKSMEDGKVDFMDVANLWGPLSTAGDAIEGADKILAEIKSLTEADKAKLTAYIKEEFDIPQDKLEATIEGGLEIALGLMTLVGQFIKKPKAEG